MHDAAALTADVLARLQTGEHVRPQYVALVEPETLDAVNEAGAGDVLAIAAHVGRTRLIDNLEFDGA